MEKSNEEILKEMVEKRYSSSRIDCNIYAPASEVLKEQYGHKADVMVTQSPYDLSLSRSLLGELSVTNVSSVKELDKGTFFGNVVSKLISKKSSMPLLGNDFTEGFLVHSCRRSGVEYNPRYWQLVVCGVIILRDGMIVLKNNEKHPRLANKMTLIQGHVDARKEMHHMPSAEYLRREFVREVLEEIDFSDSIFKSFGEELLLTFTHIEGAIQINTDEVAMDHLGIFCTTKLILPDLSVHDIKSNESSHDVVIIKDVDEITKMEDHLVDSWIKPIFKKIKF